MRTLDNFLRWFLERANGAFDNDLMKLELMKSSELASPQTTDPG